MLLLLFGLFATFEGVTGQYGIECPGCVMAVGAGTANAGDMYNPWAISYHLLKPNFQIQFTSGLIYTSVNAGLATVCKTGYTYDFGCIASSPYGANFITPTNNLIGWPVYAFPIVIIYNIPEIDPSSNLPLIMSQSVIFQIFNLNITKWNDPQLVHLNPHVAHLLPNASIRIILRVDVAPPTKAVSKAWYRFNSTLWPSPLGSTTFLPILNYTAANAINESNSYSATSTTSTTPYTIAYVPLSFAKEAGLPYATVENKAGNFVAPTTETLQEAIRSIWGPEKGYNFTLDPLDTDAPGAYPYTLVSWLLTQKVRNLECDSRREFFKFLNWCYTDPKAIAQLAGSKGSFSPLTDELREYVLQQIKNISCRGISVLEVEELKSAIPGVRSGMMVIASALISVAASIMATLVWTRNSRITRAAGLAFASAFLLGCVLNYASIFFWAMPASASYVCHARVVFLILGETLLLGSMFSKSWEVSKIFQRVEKGDLSPFQEVPWWKFCRIFFIIFVAQMLLLVILMGVDAPTALWQIQDTLNLIANRQCHVSLGNTWLGLQGIFFAVLMIWGAYLAYQTRLVWVRYKYPNESRSILLSLYNLAFSAILIIPLLFFFSADDDYLFILVSFAVIYPTTFCLALVYLPKIVSFLGSSFSSRSKGKSSERGSVHSGTTAKRSDRTVDDDSRATRPEKGSREPSRKETYGPTSPNQRYATLDDSQRPRKDTSSKVQITVAATPSKGQSTPSKGLPNLNTPTASVPASGEWRVLLNPTLVETRNPVVSIFDNPEVAAKSGLIS